ncbi:MAG: hypothetical protein OXF52_01755, partial [Candidatus Dadabacteria bacterium]|nr:hypothetical protein [Candidatus Dadabacteria bacterium]
ESLKQIEGLVHPLQEYADVERMTEEQLNEFLEETPFSETQKDEVKKSNWGERGEKYRSILFWHKSNKAKVTFGELKQYMARNGIFLEPEIKRNLDEISKILWSAIVSKEEGVRAGDRELQRDAWKEVEKTGPLYKQIERYIQKRLQSHGRKPLCKTEKSGD